MLCPSSRKLHLKEASSLLNKYSLQLVSQNRDHNLDIGASDDAESRQSVLLASLAKKCQKKATERL